MIIITLDNIKNLNNSLQVGDMIYSTQTGSQPGANDLQSAGETGRPSLVGILRRITVTGNQVVLDVDDTPYPDAYVPVSTNDFIMFSKYSQTGGDVNGYYAEATFRNNSLHKAELFSVSSEITINSK